MDNDLLLQVKNLQGSFFTYAGEVKAVRGISYDLHKGEVRGIVGESGSGKSVSSYAILGIIPHPGKVIGGEIDFDGKVITRMSEKELLPIRGRDVSMIFQDPMTCLNPVYTVGNQIDETLLKHTNMNRQQRRDRMLELLDLVGINQPEKRLTQYPHELSGGMRQRIMIAMGLCCNPKLLIADEPTTALDVTIQEQIIQLLIDLKNKLHMAVIFVTHDLGVIAEISDKISVMYGGMIVESGTSDQIFYEPKHPYTWGLLASIPNVNIDEHARLVPIEGTPIDLINPPKGCPFSPRCKFAMKCCVDHMPPLCTIDSEHTVSCWLPVMEGLKGKGDVSK